MAKIFVESQEHRATMKAFKVDQEYRDDLLIYVTDQEHRAKDVHTEWC